MVELLIPAIFQQEKGQRVKTLEEVGDILQGMDCENVNKTVADGKLQSLEWSVDRQREIVPINEGGIIPLHTLKISYDGKSLRFKCQVDNSDLEIGSDGFVGYSTANSGDLTPREKPVAAIFHFMKPFASEAHDSRDRHDLWNYQFEEGFDPKHNKVRVRIAGFMFTLVPDKGKNIPLQGRLDIKVPQKGEEKKPLALETGVISKPVRRFSLFK